jgi:hypothetical protein
MKFEWKGNFWKQKSRVELENKAHKRKQAAMWTKGTLKKKEIALNVNRRDTKYLLEKALE